MCKSFLATSLFHFVHYWTLEHGHWKIFYFMVNLSICSFIFLFLSSLCVHVCALCTCGLFWLVCSCFRRRGLPIRGFTEIADPRIFQLPSYRTVASSHYREYLIRTKACFFLEFYSYIVLLKVQKLWNRIILYIKDFILFALFLVIVHFDIYVVTRLCKLCFSLYLSHQRNIIIELVQMRNFPKNAGQRYTARPE